VPGEPPEEGLELSQSRHHADRVPEELQASSHERASAPEWFAGFFARPGLGFGMDRAFGDGADAVRAAERGTVLRGDFTDPQNLQYLRNTVGVVSALFDQGGLGVLDLHACRWWSVQEWRRRFVGENRLRVQDHIQIVVTDDDRHHPGLWVHTRGMRKFGRPDLQIKHVPGEWTPDNRRVKAAGNLLNSVAEYLCSGAVIEGGQTLSFPGRSNRCAFRLTPDDSNSEAPLFQRGAGGRRRRTRKAVAGAPQVIRRVGWRVKAPVLYPGELRSEPLNPGRQALVGRGAGG
jgi:hypothetical protein